MKDIWKNRHNNLEKIASIQKNFGYVLFESNIIESKEELSWGDFKKYIKDLDEISNPKTGDIIIWEQKDFPNVIKYAGIFLDEDKILNNEYGEPVISSISEILEKYPCFHKDIFDNDPVDMKYFRARR